MKPPGFTSFFLRCLDNVTGLLKRKPIHSGMKRSSCIQRNLPRLSKSSPLPLKRAKPARPIKVGGEVAPFPLRHPFRFHARGFPHVSALRSLPPPLRSLTCSPDPGNERRRPKAFPRGSMGRRGPGAGGTGLGAGAGARAGARSLPTAPGARHPTFTRCRSRTQTPTSPSERHDATCT